MSVRLKWQSIGDIVVVGIGCVDWVVFLVEVGFVDEGCVDCVVLIVNVGLVGEGWVDWVVFLVVEGFVFEDVDGVVLVVVAIVDGGVEDGLVD